MHSESNHLDAEQPNRPSEHDSGRAQGPAASIIIAALARRESGMASVGLKAVEFVKDR